MKEEKFNSKLETAKLDAGKIYVHCVNHDCPHIVQKSEGLSTRFALQPVIGQKQYRNIRQPSILIREDAFKNQATKPGTNVAYACSRTCLLQTLRQIDKESRHHIKNTEKLAKAYRKLWTCDNELCDKRLGLTMLDNDLGPKVTEQAEKKGLTIKDQDWYCSVKCAVTKTL